MNVHKYVKQSTLKTHVRGRHQCVHFIGMSNVECDMTIEQRLISSIAKYMHDIYTGNLFLVTHIYFIMGAN